jgi:hypothetical protein
MIEAFSDNAKRGIGRFGIAGTFRSRLSALFQVQDSKSQAAMTFLPIMRLLLLFPDSPLESSTVAHHP